MTRLKNGHSFELNFLSVIRDGLEETWGIRSSFCKFYNRKKYYSHSRKGQIEIDVSIEITRKDAETWYQLLIFECKDQKRPVDVNSLERFKEHADQIAGKNIKAFMVSRSGFSSSCVIYARTHGIGLINYTECNFDLVAESRQIIEPLEYVPKINLELLEGVGIQGNIRTLVHYKKNIKLEFLGIYCIESSPPWYRKTGCMKEEVQCEGYDSNQLEFHVATNDDFTKCSCGTD